MYFLQKLLITQTCIKNFLILVKPKVYYRLKQTLSWACFFKPTLSHPVSRTSTLTLTSHLPAYVSHHTKFEDHVLTSCSVAAMWEVYTSFTVVCGKHISSDWCSTLLTKSEALNWLINLMFSFANTIRTHYWCTRNCSGWPM